jgi:hypothetical protein
LKNKNQVFFQKLHPFIKNILNWLLEWAYGLFQNLCPLGKNLMSIFLVHCLNGYISKTCLHSLKNYLECWLTKT